MRGTSPGEVESSGLGAGRFVGRQLNEEFSKTLRQLLNQLPNFLAYDPRRNEVASVEETLHSLRSRLRAARDASKDYDRIELTVDEQQAVTLLAPKIVESLGEFELGIRTGRSTADVQALIDELTAA